MKDYPVYLVFAIFLEAVQDIAELNRLYSLYFYHRVQVIHTNQ